MMWDKASSRGNDAGARDPGPGRPHDRRWSAGCSSSCRMTGGGFWTSSIALFVVAAFGCSSSAKQERDPLKLVVGPTGPQPTLDAAVSPGPDAATGCTPQPESGDPTVWHPPAPLRSNACTPQQISAIATAWAVDDRLTLTTLRQNAANTACFACAFTDTDSSPRGAFYGNEADGYWANIAGCIAALQQDVREVGCGRRYLAAEDCVYYACQHCSDDTFFECSDQSFANVCASYVDATACSAPQQTACFADDYVAQATKLMNLFCGP